MVGIVIVSHSEMLANGLLELAEQMTKGRVPLAIAAGSGNVDKPIGTEPVRILEAIQSVLSSDGVLVLMDLGSAIMGAETALEFLDADQRQHVYLCEAPLVEGAISAAVSAAGGAPIEQVLAAARGSLVFKTDHLAPVSHARPAIPMPAPASPPIDSTPPLTWALTVRNRLGLHARPAARLVELASQFAARIELSHKGKTANAASMNQVMTLGVRQGDTLRVTASGHDAVSALAALQALADDNFGDDSSIGATPGADGQAGAQLTATPIAQAAIVRPGELLGIPSGRGSAVGPALVHRPTAAWVQPYTVTDSDAEWRRLQQAIETVEASLQQLRRETTQRVGAAEAAIFDAHLLMLRDAELANHAHRQIEQLSINAELAWQTSIDAVAASYEQLGGYLAQRAADVRDVGQAVSQQLTKKPRQLPVIERPSILVAADLSPSQVAQLEPSLVLGIVTEAGGANGHNVILARALGIPVVTGVARATEQINPGQMIALDGERGLVWLMPDEATIGQLRSVHEMEQQRVLAARQSAHQPAHMADGQPIHVAANVGKLAEIEAALTNGAEGVGVFRTEFLFMERTTAPDENEQMAVYSAAADRLQGRPLVVRTLDIGGDKSLPYLQQRQESNPFLGKRGLRLSLEQPALFKTQLRALLRTAATYTLQIMYPMVSTVEEILQARGLLEEARRELRSEGRACGDRLPVGIMIETPAAAAMAHVLARHVDFFSVGSNDLTQYVMAADRTNPHVADLASAYQPALLHTLRQVANAAHAAKIWVALCGELASDPRATALLVGLGFDELSMNPAAIPQVKAIIRTLDRPSVTTLADHLLRLSTAAEVEAFLGETTLTHLPD